MKKFIKKSCNKTWSSTSRRQFFLKRTMKIIKRHMDSFILLVAVSIINYVVLLYIIQSEILMYWYDVYSYTFQAYKCMLKGQYSNPLVGLPFIVIYCIFLRIAINLGISHLVAARIFSLVIETGLLLILYHLLKMVLRNTLESFIIILALKFDYIIFMFSNVPYRENFSLLFFLIYIYGMLIYIREHSKKHLIIGSLCLIVSILTRPEVFLLFMSPIIFLNLYTLLRKKGLPSLTYVIFIISIIMPYLLLYLYDMFSPVKTKLTMFLFRKFEYIINEKSLFHYINQLNYRVLSLNINFEYILFILTFIAWITTILRKPEQDILMLLVFYINTQIFSVILYTSIPTSLNTKFILSPGIAPRYKIIPRYLTYITLGMVTCKFINTLYEKSIKRYIDNISLILIISNYRFKIKTAYMVKFITCCLFLGLLINNVVIPETKLAFSSMRFISETKIRPFYDAVMFISSNISNKTKVIAFSATMLVAIKPEIEEKLIDTKIFFNQYIGSSKILMKSLTDDEKISIISKIIEKIENDRSIKYIIVVRDNVFFKSIKDKWYIIESKLKLIKDLGLVKIYVRQD